MAPDLPPALLADEVIVVPARLQHRRATVGVGGQVVPDDGGGAGVTVDGDVVIHHHVDGRRQVASDLGTEVLVEDRLDEHGNAPAVWPSWTWKFRAKTKKFDASSYDLRVAKPAPAVEAAGAR